MGPFHTLEENHFESLLNDDLPKKKVYDRVGTTPKSSGTFEKRSERLGSSLFIITQTWPLTRKISWNELIRGIETTQRSYQTRIWLCSFDPLIRKLVKWNKIVIYLITVLEMCALLSWVLRVDQNYSHSLIAIFTRSIFKTMSHKNRRKTRKIKLPVSAFLRAPQ